MSPWYKRSLACGIIPLIAGISIFIVWYFTRHSWLEVAGIINIAIGILLFLLGLIFLFIYVAKSRQYLKGLVPLLILLINFPVAGFTIYAVEYIKGTCSVNIINQSPYEITQFYLYQREQRYPVANIPPRSITSQEFHFKYEGTVHYSLQYHNKTHQGMLFSYVTGGIGSTVTLRLSESGVLHVSEQSSR